MKKIPFLAILSEFENQVVLGVKNTFGSTSSPKITYKTGSSLEIPFKIVSSLKITHKTSSRVVIKLKTCSRVEIKIKTCSLFSNSGIFSFFEYFLGHFSHLWLFNTKKDRF